jgi:putative inorganic carbon (HCO3(-)) transporter
VTLTLSDAASKRFALRPIPIPQLLLGGFLLLALAAAAYLSVWASPALFVGLALAASTFSGNFAAAGIPVPLDRVFLFAAIGSLIVGLPGATRSRSITWRPVHAVVGAAAAYATVSAFGSGTAKGDGLFALLDRFGLVPMLVFILGPLLFDSPQKRNAFLAVLVAVGGYLGITAIAEGIGWDFLVFPRFINDPAFGIHFGRARGPFGEAVGMGLGLYGCGVAAGVAAVVWTDVRARRAAVAVAFLCATATIFTLTRAVWLATVVATVVAMLFSPQTRRYLRLALVAGVVVLIAVFTFVPGFADQASERQSSQQPIWDRYNANRAAVNALRSEPLFGIGWDRFQAESSEYYRVADTYPLTGTNIKVHNVLLSHATELGVVGASLWLLAVLLAMGGAVLRPGPADLDPWRMGMIAVGAHWAIVGAFGPLGYAFPNLLVWTWAGICSLGHLSSPRTPA